jgi:hypothetical protein
MIAYPKESLLNLEILDESKEWLGKKIISEDQYSEIKKKHPHNLFIPNVFVRIGLFVLTIILVNAALGLFSMLFIVVDNYSDGVIAGFAIFYGVVIMAGLELAIANKKTFKAGIDDGLLYLGIGSLIFGVCFLFNDPIDSSNNELFFYSLIALPFFASAAIRYLDNIMVACAFICFNLLTFSLTIKLGSVGKAVIPFLIMISSAAVYFIAKKNAKKDEVHFWRLNLKVLQFLALITFYFAGNYFVVRELSVDMFDLNLQEGQDIPLGFVFHITTVIVPIGYLYFGGKLKDKIIFWSGLFTIVLSALTFKYYYSLGHHSVSLTLAGLAMSLITWFAIKYFTPSKGGVTSEKEDELISSDAEALIQTFSFSQKTEVTSAAKTDFGGGDFGGGGAGGNY